MEIQNATGLCLQSDVTLAKQREAPRHTCQDIHKTKSPVVQEFGRGYQLQPRLGEAQTLWSCKGSDKACREKPVLLCSTQCVLNLLTMEPFAHRMPTPELANC